MALYATDGSINVSVVTGATITGLHAANGSWNVFQTTGTQRGAYHPCGAFNVTVDNTGPNSIRAADGSMNVTTTPFNGKGAQRVTVVAGAFV